MAGSKLHSASGRVPSQSSSAISSTVASAGYAPTRRLVSLPVETASYAEIAAKGRATSGSAAVSPEKCSSSANDFNRVRRAACNQPYNHARRGDARREHFSAGARPQDGQQRNHRQACPQRKRPERRFARDAQKRQDEPRRHQIYPEIPRETALRNSFGRADTSSPCLFGRNQPVSSSCPCGRGCTPPGILLPSSSFSPADAASLRVIFHPRTAAYTPRRGTARSCRFPRVRLQNLDGALRAIHGNADGMQRKQLPYFWGQGKETLFPLSLQRQGLHIPHLYPNFLQLQNHRHQPRVLRRLRYQIQPHIRPHPPH